MSTPPSVAETTAAALTASRALVAVAARSLATVDDDVTLPQLRALVLLASRGPQLVGALADALDVRPSTATRLCDRLVTKDFVVREVGQDNRRETTIRLADAGRALVDRVTSARRAELQHIVRRLDPQRRALLVEAFTAFASAADELPADASTLGWS